MPYSDAPSFGRLSQKAAALVEAGLPWPDQPFIHNETRLLVEKHLVPWRQDQDVNDTYEFRCNLGTGGFAKVYKATHKTDGRDVAIKHISIQEEAERDIAYKEIKHLALLLDVKQVVTIYEVFEKANDVHIVMELCKGGELLNSSSGSEQTPLTYGDVGRIAVCMLVLADGMHQHGFVHCDLKPENFCLLEPLGTEGVDLVDSLRLIDFGLSQRVRGGQAIAGVAGSVPYMAPEVKTHMYDSKVDIWSIGVIIYTLLVGKLPFDGKNADEMTFNAATREPDVSGLHPAVADLVKWLLTKNPAKRPSAREALKHPWLVSTDKKVSDADSSAMAQCMSNEVVQNLAIFAASNKLQRAFMHLSVNFLNQGEMTRILAGFQTLAVDHQRKLSCAEMTGLLTKDKDEVKARRIERTIELVMGKDGMLSIEDFVVASMNQYRNLSDRVIRSMFKSLDTDDDGWISAEDAYTALHNAGVVITLEELARLFAKYGSKRHVFHEGNKGSMTFKDFSELMMPSVSQRFSHELDPILAAFKHYNSQTQLQKLARRIVANHAPMTKEVLKIKKCFELIDESKEMVITRDELAKGIRSAGYTLSEIELQTLFKNLDTDGTQLVRYHEFVAAALDHNLLLSDTMLRWIFEFMDDDNSGTIHTENFMNLLQQMDWAENEKKAMMDEVAEPGTSEVKLTFQDFVNLMKMERGELDRAGSVRNYLTRLSNSSGVVPSDKEAEPEREGPLLLRSYTTAGHSGGDGRPPRDLHAASAPSVLSIASAQNARAASPPVIIEAEPHNALPADAKSQADAKAKGKVKKVLGRISSSLKRLSTRPS